MSARYSLLVALSIGVAAGSVHQAAAQEGIVGGIIGGIIGGAIANDQRYRQQQRAQPQRTAPRPTVSSAQREQNRSVQTALNHFGWNVGSPDGALGPRSRAGISGYQTFLGFAGTGILSDFERTILLTAHQRALMGGPQVTQVVSSHPQGMRGLVMMVRDEMSGRSPTQSAGNYGLPPAVATAVDEIAASSDPSPMQLVQRAGFIQLADLNGDGRTDYILDTSVTGSAFWCSAQACTVQVFVSTPEGYVRNDFQAFNVIPAMFTCTRGTCELGAPQEPVSVAAPQPMAPAAPPPLMDVALAVPSAQPAARNPDAGSAPATAPALPNFFGTATAARSLVSHCDAVNLLTITNGGFATRDTMADPAMVLNEQFCLARTYAMATGEKLIGQLQGVSAAQVAEQCVAFAPALQPYVSALSVQSREEVLASVSAFVLQTGMGPQHLSDTARICLAVGYRQDNLDVALGAALLLATLGERAYAELMGHHLAQGFGAAKREDLALGWYEMGLDPAKRAVFAPMEPERDSLLRDAVFGQSSAQRPATDPAVTLPVFMIPHD